MTLERAAHRPVWSTLPWGGAAASMLALAAAVAWPQTDTANLVGNAERGQSLFVDYTCYACHGYTGETGSAPRLNPTRFNQAGFVAYVRNPRTNYRQGNMGNVMPPYAADGVTDQDLADIFAFIDSMPSSSPPLESIPLLNGL